jgi:hypothetical protein
MIIRKDYVPTENAKVVDFLAEFKTVFTAQFGNFNFTQEEADVILADIDLCIADYGDKKEKQHLAKGATGKFNVSKKKALETVRKYVNRIKPAPKYTTDIGNQFGIIGEEVIIDPATMKPVLDITLKANVPLIKWRKDHSEGVNIHCRRGDETEFTLLVRENSSPYLDNRPNLEPGKPEAREYTAFYIFDDVQDGLESDTVKVLVK